MEVHPNETTFHITFQILSYVPRVLVYLTMLLVRQTKQRQIIS
jgi:hypothetical protein